MFRRQSASPTAPTATSSGYQPAAVLVIAGPDADTGRSAAIDPRGTMVGRGTSCDLVLASAQVSRQHAAIYLRGGEYVIEDLGSVNGTRLNGDPVTHPLPLHHGDQIDFADVEVLFQLMGAPSREQMPPQPRSWPTNDSGWAPDRPTDPLGTPRVARPSHPPRSLRRDLQEAQGFSGGTLLLAVLGSVVGASLTGAFGSGAWGALGGAALGPVISTTFSTRRTGEKGRVRNATIVILSVGALVITVTGFSFADHVAGRSVLPGAGERPNTFPLSDNQQSTVRTDPPKAPGIRIDPHPPDALDCGTVTIGQDAPCIRSVTITSAGSDVLEITSAEVIGRDHQDFTPGDDCVGASLDPGETCEMPVQFQPTTAGPRQATLVIHQNLPRPDRGTEVALAGGGASDPGMCIQGFVWREAVPGDHVCVAPATRTQAAQDNQLANSRRSPTGGDFGPDTCLQGFVWREAVPGDHVCVTPATRTQTAEDNRLADSRRAG